jgi:tol-pal system protein YbgF
LNRKILLLFRRSEIYYGISFPSFFKENLLLGLIFAVFLGGCATQGNLSSIQRDANYGAQELMQMQKNVSDLNAEIKKISSKVDAQAKKQNDLQQEISVLSSETKSRFSYFEKKVESSGEPMRHSQAGLGARLDKLQAELQNLTGRFEAGKNSAEKTFRETQNVRERSQARLDNLAKRITVLSRALDNFETNQGRPAGKFLVRSERETEERAPASVRPKSDASPVPAARAKKNLENPQGASDLDEAFKKAFDLFAAGDIEGAKTGFQSFLQAHGNTRYAESAHFWLGECYFRGKKFEEAILEYEEVINKFPKGNKAPDALFRQAAAFFEMKDTANAKLMLKELIKRYPNTTQAARARAKLKEVSS